MRSIVARLLVVMTIASIILQAVPRPGLAAEAEPSARSGSGRRYWLQQAERDRERDRARERQIEQYRREDLERERRALEWWRKEPTEAPKPEEN
jgi:hypothetical protein